MPRRLDKQISELRTYYRNLTPAARLGLWALLVLEVVLVGAAQRDIQRRPADLIRGPKLLWRVVAMLNVIGPAAYFGLGRRRMPGKERGH